jgi:tRNA uridine 5-carboxymethylaminomethyl modification enzyme
MFEKYDVIVVGGGHAGCEAAAAAANMGSKVLLVTMNMATIGQMSCNPAMGGIAKGQIVREIDAMGGYSGIVSDKTAIQFKMLNRSKGPAMWSPRAQNDRMRFAEEWRLMLERTPNVDFFQDMVKELIIENDTAKGVITGLGLSIRSQTVILTNGTFLNGLIHIGTKNFGGGRSAESAAFGITEQLTSLGFKSGRMKTGTPPRVDGRSLDYSVMIEQPGDDNPQKFSYSNTDALTKQLSCWMTYTSESVHDELRKGFDRSPMFSGRIQGLGPRYCPSIEDKIERFADKDKHQLFIEPEGWNTVEVYVNGFSTSLPEEVQMEAMRKIKGFEKVKMFRPGYAIEYDYFPPQQLQLSLETKAIKNLFFAGQINGTTGYEEAAGQGIIAGINAHLLIKNEAPLILKRSEAYLGVLIDDLVTKGTEEPYRMFTSRAEYRILLRQDNADFRLTEKSFNIGLASQDRMNAVEEKYIKVDSFLKELKKQSVEPNEVNEYLNNVGSSPIQQKLKINGLISRPSVSLPDMLPYIKGIKDFVETKFLNSEEVEEAEILIKYEGYIQKEQEVANKLLRLEHIELHSNFDYASLQSLSSEARQKLSAIKPKNIGQASRISGISPSDISVLMVYLGR